MTSISVCKKNNLCVDCKETRCYHCGKLSADCPKYWCDNVKTMDCENCEFIREYVKNARKEKLCNLK